MTLEVLSKTLDMPISLLLVEPCSRVAEPCGGSDFQKAWQHDSSQYSLLTETKCSLDLGCSSVLLWRLLSFTFETVPQICRVLNVVEYIKPVLSYFSWSNLQLVRDVYSSSRIEHRMDSGPQVKHQHNPLIITLGIGSISIEEEVPNEQRTHVMNSHSGLTSRRASQHV